MVDDFIGLIPAAGKGLRLGLPYPKELYPIIRDNHYKPIAQFVLTNLTVAGLQHVVFVINETKHQLISYFGNGQRFGCQISYVVQERLNHQGESTSPGLANALDSAYHLVKDKTVFLKSICNLIKIIMGFFIFLKPTYNIIKGFIMLRKTRA